MLKQDRRISSMASLKKVINTYKVLEKCILYTSLIFYSYDRLFQQVYTLYSIILPVYG